MSITLDFTQDEQERLENMAKAQGTDVTTFIRYLIFRQGLHTATWGAKQIEKWEQEGSIGHWQDRGDSLEIAQSLRESGRKTG
jgi:hypothetical protein